MFEQAVTAIKDALVLTENVRRTGEVLKDVVQEVRQHDRRITRLEAQWDTAIMLSQKKLE